MIGDVGRTEVTLFTKAHFEKAELIHSSRVLVGIFILHSLYW
jgi:hypothetical protein